MLFLWHFILEYYTENATSIEHFATYVVDSFPRGPFCRVSLNFTPPSSVRWGYLGAIGVL